MPLDNQNIKGVENSVYQEQPDIYHKETKSVPAPERGIGIDTQKQLFDNIINAAQKGQLDVTSLDAFRNISQSRDSVYGLLDAMCQDATVAAVLETYAEDATEYSESGRIVWCEASDSKIQQYIEFLLDTMNIDKHIYKWTHSLCKYGDIYLRLYRESDYEDADLFKSFEKGKKVLNEAVKVKAYSKNDHYVNYLEMEQNPAELFELTKFGKTYAYVKAPVTSTQSAFINDSMNQTNYNMLSYKFKKGDVTLHGATDFVHGCLEDSSSRTPEKVQIFLTDDENGDSLSYTVKRGQSLLYNTFKTWRELQLLENSVLLNRLTKSSIVRMINVEVGDMPKEMVGVHLQGIKALIEQRSALNTGNSISEYTNPGPIENNIYVPTHEGIGAITTTQVGGDVDVKSLADLSYYQDKWFGSARVPKQYFGVTDDNAGFSGGQSLSIISSRYGKMVKRIQSVMTQVITDAINLLLLDRGLKNYVNEFTIRMLPPTTQEELDRRENLSNKVGLATDVMNMLSDIEDVGTKLKVLKSLLSNILTNTEVIELIQIEIDKLEATEKESEDDDSTDTSSDTESEDDGLDTSETDFSSLEVDDTLPSMDLDSSEETIEPMGDTDNYLPSPEELGQDFTVNT